MYTCILQVAGCILYYILSDGHVPHEAVSPYRSQPDAVMSNIRLGKFELDKLDNCEIKATIAAMIHHNGNERPVVDECLKHFQGE